MRIDQACTESAHAYRIEEIIRGLDLDQCDPEPNRGATRSSATRRTDVPEGGRNNTLTRLAGSLRATGASEADILAVLLDYNATVCAPPLSPTEVANIAASIAKYPTNLFDLNDTGNANRLIRKYGDEIRYVPKWNYWLLWDGTRWARDESRQIVELAKATARAIFQEAHVALPKAIKLISAHANSSHQAARIRAMIELAQSCPGIPVDVKDLDSHSRLLTVANGTLNLSTGVLQLANKADMITRASPVAYDPTATCPTFDQFIQTVTNGDAALANFLQRLVGYCLSGDTSDQKLYFLYGSGANGKSTFLSVVRELLGEELSRQCPTQTLMTQRHGRGASNDLARLAGVRVAIGTEIEEGSHFDEPLIKQMTGGEPITARFLFAEFFELIPQFKVMVAGNHKPVIKGDDEGIWRRIELIPFTANIPQAQRDPKLMEKLRAELPGILNWALAGFRQWEAQGMSPPKVVTDASKEYRDEMDILADWINDQCVVGPNHQAGSKQLFSNYKTWCWAQGYKALTHNPFSRKLEGRYPKKRTASGVIFDGIKLK